MPFNELSENRTPLFATIPHKSPFNFANPVTKVVPKFFLNSSNSDPSTILIIISLTSNVSFGSAGNMPLSSFWSYNGSSKDEILLEVLLFTFKFLIHCLAKVRACSSFSARWSATPDIFVWTSPPPRLSESVISPVAAFTKGGPAKKIVP